MIDAEASGINTTARDDGQGPDPNVWVAVTEASAPVSISPPSAGQIAWNHNRTPPLDLLTLLQHFTI